jgi:hypothetical protein
MLRFNRHVSLHRSNADSHVQFAINLHQTIGTASNHAITAARFAGSRHGPKNTDPIRQQCRSDWFSFSCFDRYAIDRNRHDLDRTQFAERRVVDNSVVFDDGFLRSNIHVRETLIRKLSIKARQSAARSAGSLHRGPCPSIPEGPCQKPLGYTSATFGDNSAVPCGAFP